MERSIVLLVICFSSGTLAGRRLCEKAAIAAALSGDRVPQCTESGQFALKQCNDIMCWCVKRGTGTLAYHNQTLPLNIEYDCSVRRGNCLEEYLSLLEEGVEKKKLPYCDERGRYHRKQCTLVTSPECDEFNSREKRDAPECVPAPYGFEAKDRAYVDHIPIRTMVSVDPFRQEGEIRSFELYSGSDGRLLRIGIYRPKGDDECSFKLVQQKEWSSFRVGYNKIDLAINDSFKVKAGDHYGFSWNSDGVVKFNDAVDANYCEAAIFADRGDDVILRNATSGDDVDDAFLGSREYSLRVTFTPCPDEPVTTTPEPPAPTTPIAHRPDICDICYCVDPETGVEIEKTRTSGILDCHDSE